MATGTLPDSDREKQISPNESDALFERTYGDDVARGIKEAEEALEAAATDTPVGEAESKGTVPTATHKNNWTGKDLDMPRLKKVVAFAKRRGGIIGLIALFGVGGGIMASIFAPASMLINLMENFTLTNDSSSLNLERRFLKAFGFSISGTDPVCQYNIQIKCNGGKISNSGLYRLNKKGIVAYFADGSTYDGKKGGYPSRNPTGYTIDLDDGVGPRNVLAPDLPGFLAANPAAAAKILGQTGAFNLRVKAWTGKHITNKLYKKFNINRSGGVATGNTTGVSAEEHRQSLLHGFRERISNIGSSVSSVTDAIQGKIEGQLGRARKGGVGYTVAVAGCIGVKAPAYIAGGYAAVQLAQILPFSMDFVLSPGSLAKSTTIGGQFTSDDMNAIGTTFTERVPNANGKMSSALDSQILLSAMGANKGAPALSPSFTPGYALLTNSTIRAANQVDETLEPACNTILSPAAMYSALAVDSAVTVAASATIIGGIAKVIISSAVAIAAEQAISSAVMSIAKTVLTDLATNDAIPQARGEAFGDVVGISATSLFAAGGMANHLPTLTQSQLPSQGQAFVENEAFHRDMDVASLSPFDTSSKYTFLGSIVNNLRMGVLLNNNYTGSLSSVFSSLLNISSTNYSSSVGASANFSAERCSYADEFGFDTGNPETTPAITVSGLPCTGYTDGQAAMQTSEAIDLIASEGWLNEDVKIDVDDTIEDLVSKGYFKADTPLTDTISSCSDASTGDYTYNIAGCMVSTETKNPNDPRYNTCVPDDDGEVLCASDSEAWAEQDIPEGVKNAKSLAATNVFLGDYMIHQMINGHNDTPSQALKDEAAFNTDDEPAEVAVQPSQPLVDFVAPTTVLSSIVPQTYDKIGYSRLVSGVITL
jgi:hypothetical protein